MWHVTSRSGVATLRTANLLNLFKSKKTTYNKRLAAKTVAVWELKVVVSRAEPVRITFDWRE